MSLAPRVWSAALPLLTILALALAPACTKRNPDLCCATDAECTAIGFSSHAPCDLGVCVKNECTTTAGVCDDDADCAGNPAAPFCVAGTCAACASSASCPASAPVCDAATHDCRACVSDGECESGACDLEVGTCVDPANIRYASPTGNETQPCSHTQPCSFLHASSTADSIHPYVVLLPGTHTSGGFFDGQTAIVCGSGASLQASNSTISLNNGATVTLRGFTIAQTDPNDNNDFNVFNCDKCELTLQDMNIQVASRFWDLIAEFHGKSLIIQHSTLQGGHIQLFETDVTFDRSTFMGDIQIRYSNDGHSLNIANSLFDFGQAGSIDITGTDTTLLSKSAFIYNNTFSGGQFGCDANDFFPENFEANIFYNTSLLAGSSSASLNCIFKNNLIFPSLAIPATGNLTGDPQFVSPANHDYHLQPLSPARDASQRDLADVDHDNVSRPQGAHNDLGAYEYKMP